MWGVEPNQENRTIPRRLDAIFGGPVWWAVHLGGTYWLIPRTCELGTNWPIHVLTVAMVALCARAGLSALQVLTAARAAGSQDDVTVRRDIYLGWLGLLFSIFFGAVTAFEWIPILFLSPCY
jgi:hypothetical protein